ncbi:PREDICTED: glioma tumor suppressor candidate region gene 2 protein [Nanorana parkeri]|uniref:glioma tumor suppressor candidate region gene 2 protein n=1 Tax=Nanorana parkeri TaxID=125878 RepID=UPI0008540DB2|nr:PREDICTED: glioma tumor suppressor candidate region gene 2 protein [Nanorana parkeri]
MVASGKGRVEEGFLGFSEQSKCGQKGTLKRKRVNRNKKKNWKRHSDVQDVEEFLDDVRLQERTAGGLLAEKKDESLFFVDTGNEQKDSKVNKRREKPLRIDLILQPDSKVPVPKDILSHQIPNGQKLKRKRERVEKLEKKGVLPRSERLLRAQLNKPKTLKPEANNNPSRGFYDMWGDNNPLDSALEGKDQWFLQQTKKGHVKRPDRLNKKPSQLPAVEVAAPGASYNPTYESHQVLLLQAHEVEVKKLKEEEKLERQLKLPAGAQLPTEESRLQELCEGLVEESEDDMGEEESEAQKTACMPRRERKTERQRRKEKEAKFRKVRQDAEKTDRLRRQGLFQLKSLHASLKTRQGELLKRKKLREEKRKLQALQPRRLGRLRYKEPDIDVLLSEELTDSLRKIKPEGSLAKDRFKSFQKRSLIEPRERAKFKRKLKVKYVEKRAFREITL